MAIKGMPAIIGAGLCLMIGIYVQSVWGQCTYPDSIKIPVTFYDFHSNGSCPDFNPGYMNGAYTPGVHHGMVADTLDQDGLPILGTSVNLNWGIDKWFRPWQPGDFRVPVYNRPMGTLQSIIQNSGYDTSYKNIVIQDTLSFSCEADSPGFYKFTSSDFFRLDGKGFGFDEGTLTYAGQPIYQPALFHNYSFAMHMHFEFPYIPGQIFKITGDDDVWVYIGHKLAIDLGGLHAPIQDSFTFYGTGLFYGFTPGKKYDFDMFYCERQAYQSSLEIVTNFVLSPQNKVSSLNIVAIPQKDTVQNGDSLILHAELFDTSGAEKSECSYLVKWKIQPDAGGGSLRDSIGGNNIYYAATNTGICRIIADYYNVFTSKTLSDTFTVFVNGPPTPSSLEFLSISKAREKAKTIREYYNLRGQKLFHYGIRNADGIVLERVIEPTGKVSVRKKLVPKP